MNNVFELDQSKARVNEELKHVKEQSIFGSGASSTSKQIQIYNIKENHLSNHISKSLLMIILGLFSNQEHRIIIKKEINDFEIKALKAILKKAFISKGSFDDVTKSICTRLQGPEKYIDHFRTKIYGFKKRWEDKRKRKEEKMKFVFKRIFKTLMQQFKENNREDLSKLSEEAKQIKFYKYYFNCYCKANKKPLNITYDPESRSILENTVFKSQTNEYRKFIFENKDFKELAFNIIDHELLANYQEYSEKLIKKILSDITENSLIKEKFNEKRFLNLINKKKKFPWPSINVKEALKEFKDSIEILISNQPN